MKKITSPALSSQTSLLMLCLLASAPIESGQLDASSLIAPQTGLTANSTTDRLIVKFKQAPDSNTLPQELTNLLKSLTGTTSSHIRETFTGAKVIKLDQEISTEEMETLTDDLERQDFIQYAEPDLIMHPLFTPNDPQFNEQWHYFQDIGGIQLPSAWDITQGENVVVAVVDSGYQPHSDLTQNLLPGYDLISDEFVANDGDGRDSDATDTGDYAPSCNDYISTWHGTHVAGTIAALTDNALGVAGIAYKAKVIPVRVVGRCGGYLSDIMDGLAWAAGAEVPGLPINPNPAQVINMSLGGPSPDCPDTALTAIDKARQLGATVIVAAGNSSEDSAGLAPANCPGVITIAATDENGSLADFSNYGDSIDLVAPGVEILSTYNTGIISPGDESYRYMSGTSMATPHVSGVAALLYSLKPEITPDEVEQILRESAQPFPSSCTGCGSGILDAKTALEMLQNTEPDITLLSDGVTVTQLEGEENDTLMFAIDVPSDALSLSIKSFGDNGDADLYVRHESQPTLELFDCRPYRYGNNEQCSIRPASPGRYYVMLHGYTSFSGVNLIADYILEADQSRTGEIFENLDSYPIPQSNLNGISSPITVNRTGNTGQVQIEVGITHDRIREISVTLIDPAGGRHKLKGFGGSGADLFQTYYLDLGDLASEGEWQLKVKDLGPYASGTLEFWRIVFPPTE
jgi:serine protease